MELHGRTVGLVGYGSIPRILAPILVALGARVLYTARSEKRDAIGEARGLAQLLSESDIVSLHVPLTDETADMIDADAIALMKPGAVLINTGRGEVVERGALLEALTSGKLAAAGLDVFATEPVAPDDPLLELGNVLERARVGGSPCTRSLQSQGNLTLNLTYPRGLLVSPHVAWQTQDTLRRSLAVAVENCRRLRAGEALLHRVN